MGKIPVFAGLGSDALFSDATRDQAFRDSRLPHGKILIEACHRAFVEEVTIAAREAQHDNGIDLDDLLSPKDLIEPCQRYHGHPAVQNATLCVVQSLRHLALQNSAREDGSRDSVATAGFCMGLLTAVAVASSDNVLQFIANAEHCFRAAILIGLASWRMRREVTKLPSELPWSLVVANIGQDEMSKILSSYDSQHDRPPIFISAINSAHCVTISGKGIDLQRFVKSQLPSKCSVRPTNIHSLYHNERYGQAQITALLEDSKRRKLRFPSTRDLIIPLLNTIDGSLIKSDDQGGQTDLYEMILKMTLAAPTNWVAVQDAILTVASEMPTDNSVAVWNYGPGYGALTGHEYVDLNIEVRDVSRNAGSSNHNSEDIAIVGVGVDLPGAPDLETFWQNLMNGINSCSEIPEDRFHIEDYYTGGDAKPVNRHRSMGTKYGNFLDNPFDFDNELFGISPREASSIDPQQRLMLQTVHRALESAGYVPDSSPSFSRETFGCFVGSATLDYVNNLRDDIDVYYSPGTLRAFISGRISYAYKWSGPSLTVDTACSSSLTALYQASRALVAGDCRAAIAGGVNIITSPDMYLGLDKAHFLSPTGQCKAFDESADGYCRSEGCASFVLKRLSDAVAENDRIFGVIKGIAMNQSGLTSSITHPHAPTQERLFESLLRTTNINPHDVTVVEAHGTGTQAGDPNELKSIRGVFAKSRQSHNKLHVTSVKSNIGHLEAASGGAALAKLLLMVKHERIPPQALLQNLNPSIDELGRDETYITSKPRDWQSNGKLRTALLNNFGAAGSNGALLLQEHVETITTETTTTPSLTYVYGCSARNEDLLEQAREEMLEFLEGNGQELRISDICYTSTARRKVDNYRLTVTASTTSELAANLRKARVTEAPGTDNPVSFLFSGQGSQYAGMGRGLLQLLPTFRKCVLHCNQRLVEWGFPGCLDVIQTEDTATFDIKNLENIQSLQCGVFVLEVALARSLIGLGLKPALVAGHSLGELAALVIADVLDLDSGLWLVAERARLIVTKCELFASSMVAINMPAFQVRQELLTMDQFASLTVSCENSPSDCVVGGSIVDVKELVRYISEETDNKAVVLDVPVGYHTAALDPVLEPLAAAASTLTFSPPSIPVASNVLGRLIAVGEEDVIDHDYTAAHCKGPVAFNSSIVDAHEQIDNLDSGWWLEIGPHPMLLPMIAKHGASQRFATLRKDKPADQTLAELFAALYRDGVVNVGWRTLFESLPDRPRLVDIPVSPMSTTRFLVPFKREIAQGLEMAAATETLPYTFLQRKVETSKTGEVVYETPIRAMASAIKGHLVCGTALCPASVYTEMALAAVTCERNEQDREVAYKLSKVKFLRPLLFLEGSEDIIRVTLQRPENGKGKTDFEISSFAAPESDAKVHCVGTIKEQAKSKAGSKMQATEQALSRRRTNFQNGEHQTFSTSIMYDKIFSRVVEYSSAYRAVKKIYLDDKLEEIFASCALPPTEDHYAGQPILLDTMLHVAGFAANLNVDNETVCICHHVHSTTVLRGDVAPGQAFDVHCSNFINTEDPDCVLADAHAVDDHGVIAVIKGMEFRRSKLAKLQAAFEFASQAPSRRNSKPESASTSPARRESKDSDEVPTEQASVTESTRGTSSPGTSRSIATSQDTVITILSEATGVDPKKIDTRTTLSAMGVDSIMMFELDRKLEEAIGQKPSVSELSACKTVGDMENLVTRSASRGATPVPMRSRSSPTSRSPKGMPKIESTTSSSGSRSPVEPESALTKDMLELLERRLGHVESPNQIQWDESSPEAPPIYLIHPGAGICLHYNRLDPLNRDVYTIQDGRLLADLKDDWKSIEEVAQNYANMIAKHSSDFGYQSVIIAGWSFGGIIAFEAARKLQSNKSTSTLGVVLIDPPQPKDHKPIARETIEVAMDATLKLSKPRSKAAADFEAAIGALTIRNNLRRAALLGKYRPSPKGPLPRIVLLRSSEGLDLGVEGLPENEWLHDRSDPSICTRAWEELMGEEIDVLDIPGDHFTPFEKENIDGTADGIRKACRMLEEGQ
ncbi:Conidial yellow pigment biosynthesis polyketide synthase [Cercospora beticola]|uniref:Conidial yellow pigment biosynthesis polyketide synthase n=1 Tax=Cercospora beticola TaxID=122368 RepID=A0A2G5HK73_CERBT|nr:Conidial yellow pigment biosynthesis polyketide synthase [Cercospora beticola]PIA92961.1 Conidial yellow pigment biosynthesis polyketide synthase [Cercospora beticola]WPB02105.1 hypothetical protein RHO25_006739 [Cercospora beticola]